MKIVSAIAPAGDDPFRAAGYCENCARRPVAADMAALHVVWL